MEKGIIVAISISERKGERKHSIREAVLVRDRGIEHDAHAEGGHRQVSLLMDESIERIRREGIDVGHGDFAENIVTRGVDLSTLEPEDLIRIGENTLLQVTMIGKECLTPCRIYHEVGYCIMPEEGVFCRVFEPGMIRVGDTVAVERNRLTLHTI
jgi:MOSC domain-containing protein YiiM